MTLVLPLDVYIVFRIKRLINSLALCVWSLSSADFCPIKINFFERRNYFRNIVRVANSMELNIAGHFLAKISRHADKE